MRIIFRGVPLFGTPLAFLCPTIVLNQLNSFSLNKLRLKRIELIIFEGLVCHKN